MRLRLLWLSLLVIVAACAPGQTFPTVVALTATTPVLLVAATLSASSPPVPVTPTQTPPLPTPTAPPPTLAPTPILLPTPDAEAKNRVIRLPILMYHYVEPWPTDAGELRRGLTVRPEDFAAQIQYLHEHGYLTVSLYDLAYSLALGQPLPERAVVLTFDDGYRSLLDYAAPTLKTYGYTGTVFVITELMDREFERYLTWPQAESLYAQGWKIEPHTKTHAELAGQDRDFQVYQMLGSAQTVQAHIGVMPRFFAYPAGKYDDLTVQLAREMNLWGAVTVEFGRVHSLASRYTLQRVRVDGRGTLRDFVNGVEGDLEP
jgi:peptidoglycan/xylan/chitin deacetylase (PgdA/CDA1 family)